MPYNPIREVEYGCVEWQAYEFAGRLLVLSDALREAFQTAIQSAQAAGCCDWLPTKLEFRVTSSREVI